MNKFRQAGQRLLERARAESRRRRLAWAALAAFLVIGPMVFELSREERFSAAVDIFPSAVGPYPPVSDPSYYRSFLHDLELRRQMRLNTHAAAAELSRATFSATPRHLVVLTVSSDEPERAQELVNALAQQIAGATRRQLAAQAGFDVRTLTVRLRSGHARARERRRITRHIHRIRPLVTQPQARLALGAAAPRPRRHSWADDVADALPGTFPARVDVGSVGLAGMMVAAALWLAALLARPPVRAQALQVAVAGPLAPGVGVPALPARLPRRLPTVVLAVTGIALVAVVMLLGRELSTFRLDEWAFVLDRQGNSLDDLLRPHNEHLSLIPVLVFKGLLATVGMHPYWPYRLVVAGLTVAIGVLVYLYAKPRLGRHWGLLPALLSMLVGRGGYDVVWPFQIGFDTSVACGVGILLCFDRRSARSDLLAGLLLFVALCSSSLGLAVAAAAIVHVIASPGRRPARALRILAAPLILYATWWLHYRPSSQTGSAPPLESIRLLVDVSGSAVAGLFSTPLGLRGLLALGLLVAVAVGLVRRRGDRRALVVACVMPAAYWALLVLARGSTGSQLLDSRYILPGSIFVACVLCELSRGWTVRARPWMAAVAAVAVVAALVNDVRLVRGIANFEVAARAENLQAELAALSLAGEAVKVNPSFAPAPVEAPTIQAGRYFQASARFGDAVPHPEAVILRSSPRARTAADTTYLRAARVYPLRTGAPPSAVAARCTTTNASPEEFDLPPRGLAVRAPRGSPVAVGVRRWGAAFVSAGQAAPRVWVRVGSGADRATTATHVQIRGVGVRVCPILG